MHLNDQQLIELDECNLSHIASCATCRQRAEVLKQLRIDLQEVVILEPLISLDDGWQALKLEQQIHIKNVSFNLDKRRAQRWWLSGISFAASILLMVIVFDSPYSSAPNVDHNAQLIALIEQNKLLQQQLVAMQENNQKAAADYGQLRYQLTMLDQKIQQAYIDVTPAEQKLALWLERQKAIEHWLTKKPIPKSINI
ncbi:MAG: hypothetical protein HRT52_17460 [Colwellia sp.]|nr:hypothetical protein [Colwellia sp.]